MLIESGEGQLQQAACANCKAVNPPNHRFCGGCGESLWEPCLSCGSEAPTGTVYCGSCGADRRSLLGGWVDKCETALAKADEYRQNGQYRDALMTLMTINRRDHARLSPFAAEAKRLIEEVKAESKQRQAEALEVFVQAQHAAEETKYDRARELLESVPAELRTEPAQALLSQMQAICRERDGLTRTIREAVAQKAYQGLLPKVLRLLELRPGYTEAERLAEQLEKLEGKHDRGLAKQLSNEARQALKQNAYQLAERLLDEVPESAHDEAFGRLYETVAELAALNRYLRDAPLVDKKLLALAERLCKYREDDAAAAKGLSHVRERIAVKVKDRRLPAPLWSQAPAEPRLGMPAAPLAFPRSIGVEDAQVAAQIQRHPCRFVVACGVALAALEQATMSVNMLSQESSVLERFGLKKRHKPPTTAWGLDLSPSGLKAVRLEIDQSADEAALVEVRATACDHEPYAEALEQLSSVEAREAIQHQAVKAFLSRWDLKGARVGVGFPGSATLGRFFQLPPLFSSKLAEIVEYEARGRIPLPLESLAWGSHVFGAAAASGDELMCRRAAIIAARQDQVREHLGPLEQSDLEIHLVTSDGAALFNIAARELLDGRYPDDLDPDDAEATIAMLDVGAEHTNLVVAGRTTTWFRSISRGGLHAVRQIARELNVTHDRAHAILVEPTKSPRLYRVEQAMAPLLDDLYAEVVRSLTTFHNDHPGYQVKRLYGVGGAFLMHGLWKRLR